MPYKGFKSITVREDVYNELYTIYKENIEHYRKQGITSFSGFVSGYLYDLAEREKKRLEE